VFPYDPTADARWSQDGTRCGERSRFPFSMSHELIGVKKKSRLRGALPEAGRKDGRGKGRSPSRSKDSRNGKEINAFCLVVTACLFLFASIGAWSGRAAWWKLATNLRRPRRSSRSGTR